MSREVTNFSSQHFAGNHDSFFIGGDLLFSVSNGIPERQNPLIEIII